MALTIDDGTVACQIPDELLPEPALDGIYELRLTVGTVEQDRVVYLPGETVQTLYSVVPVRGVTPAALLSLHDRNAFSSLQHGHYKLEVSLNGRNDVVLPDLSCLLWQHAPKSDGSSAAWLVTNTASELPVECEVPSEVHSSAGTIGVAVVPSKLAAGLFGKSGAKSIVDTLSSAGVLQTISSAVELVRIDTMGADQQAQFVSSNSVSVLLPGLSE